MPVREACGGISDRLLTNCATRREGFPFVQAGLALFFGFTAIALGLVGYVTTLFKLSAIFAILWACVFLGEGQMRSRFPGVCVMVVGRGLVAM
jgi:uncharacterized membrane protein